MQTSFGDRIKALRANQGQTQADFGRMLGVSGSVISRIESNIQTPSGQLTLIICSVFHVREEWLRTGEGNVFDAQAVREILRSKGSGSATGPGTRVQSLIEPINLRAERILPKIEAILAEGDREKIEAVEKILSVLAPKQAAGKRESREESPKRIAAQAKQMAESDYWTRATEILIKATSALKKRKRFLTIEELRATMKKWGKELTVPKSVVEKDIVETIFTVVSKKPGIDRQELLRATPDLTAGASEYYLTAAIILGKIRQEKELGSYRYYPT